MGGPGRETLGVTTKPLGAGDGGQHTSRLWQKILAGMIEIVGVLVMAEQDRIDVADRLGPERWAG